MERIVVGYDGSPAARKALKRALEISARFGSKVYVVHVVDTALLSLSEAFAPSMLAALREAGEKVLQEASREAPGVEARLLEGDPAHEIVRFAAEVGASLIVVGSRGLSTIRRMLMGSVSSRVVQESPVDVLVVKG